jgi:hypothetical protein
MTAELLRNLTSGSHILNMQHDPGNIALCKHCKAAWFVKESDLLVKIMNKREEEGRKYFMCRECGHETTIITKKGKKFTEMDYDEYLIFSIAKAV